MNTGQNKCYRHVLSVLVTFLLLFLLKPSLWFMGDNLKFVTRCSTGRFESGEPGLQERVSRVVLLWVNNHFTDFETDPHMMEFLEQFEAGLEREAMTGQLGLLNIACAAKARVRCVTLARPSRDQVLHFSVLGGDDRKYGGIFISQVKNVYSL